MESSSCDFAHDRLASALTLGFCFPLTVLNDGGCASTSSATSEQSCTAFAWGKGEVKENNCREIWWPV